MLAKFHIRGNLTFKFANLGPTWSQLGSILGGFQRCLSGVEAILDANITINILIIVILSVIIIVIIILSIIMTDFAETKSLENSRNSDYVLIACDNVLTSAKTLASSSDMNLISDHDAFTSPHHHSQNEPDAKRQKANFHTSKHAYSCSHSCSYSFSYFSLSLSPSRSLSHAQKSLCNACFRRGPPPVF